MLPLKYKTINQYLFQPNELSDTTKVTISNYETDIKEPSLSMARNSGPQITSTIQNVSVTAIRYHLQSGPHTIELRQKKVINGEFSRFSNPIKQIRQLYFNHMTSQILSLQPTLIDCQKSIPSCKNFKDLH